MEYWYLPQTTRRAAAQNSKVHELKDISCFFKQCEDIKNLDEKYVLEYLQYCNTHLKKGCPISDFYCKLKQNKEK